MKKIQISPSILSADFSQLGNEIKRLEEGGADMIHVDVMDGHFVPNLTIGPPVIKNLRKYTNIPFDVHLMISPVHKYIKDYANAGADIITFHPEATDDLMHTVDYVGIIELVKQQMAIRSKMIEHPAKRIVDAILPLNKVQKVTVEVEKIQPPIDATFDKIS